MRHDDIRIQKTTDLFETNRTFVIIQRCPIVKNQKRYIRFVLNMRYKYERLFTKGDNECNRNYRIP